MVGREHIRRTARLLHAVTGHLDEHALEHSVIHGSGTSRKSLFERLNLFSEEKTAAGPPSFYETILNSMSASDLELMTSWADEAFKRQCTFETFPQCEIP